MKHLKLFLVALVIFIGAFFMPKIAHAEVYKGIDVYEYSDIDNYQALKNSGVSVVIQKATQGLNHDDALLNYRANMLPKYGFKVGYYHYANNSGNPIGEAQHFLLRVQGLHSDTILWLDIENESQWSKSQAISYTNQFINYVQSKGYKIGIYSGLSFYYEYLNGNMPDVPLWLASYGKQPLQYPSQVSWQYSESDYVNGMVGHTDGDYFNDSIFTGVKPNTTQNNSTSNINTQATSNSSISSLQAQLNSLINSNLRIDGQDGPATQAAIRNFQSIMGLPVDGIAGSQTWSAINQIRSYPTDGIIYPHYKYATRWIQWRVGASIDGKFGNGTALKVRDFQGQYGLYQDGVVGKQTWTAMFKY